MPHLELKASFANTKGEKVKRQLHDYRYGYLTFEYSCGYEDGFKL